MDETLIRMLAELPLPVLFVAVGAYLANKVLEKLVPQLQDYTEKQHELLRRLIESEEQTKNSLQRLVIFVETFESRLDKLEDTIKSIPKRSSDRD